MAVVVRVALTEARETLALERELARVGAEVRREHRVCVSGVIFPVEFVEGTFRGRDVGYGCVPEREHLRECERFHEGELPIG